MFTELYEDGGVHPDGRPAFDNMARFGANMRPIDYEPEGLHSPVFHYPYDQTKNALINLKKADEVDPFHGIKMQYLNPNTGEPAMPTLDCYMQLLPSNLETQEYQSTATWVYSVVEGTGQTVINLSLIHI